MQVFSRQEIQHLRKEWNPIFSTEGDRLPATGDAPEYLLDYRPGIFDIVPEIEAAAVLFVETAEQRSIRLQLYLSPACMMVRADRLYFQQVCYRMLREMIARVPGGAVIRIYVTNSDGKCVMEFVSNQESVHSEDYFKKYRITNPPSSATAESPLVTYKKIMEDMNGELAYSFGKGSYVRMKLRLV